MTKNIRGKICLTFVSLLICSALVSACSIDLSQSTAATPTDGNSQGFSTATLPPQTQDKSAATALPTLSIPVTWANLNLTGRLVYTSAHQEGNAAYLDIRVLDLATGKIMVIFKAPPAGWIYFSTVSPDGKQLVMAYTLPSGTSGTPHQELYILPIDGSSPPHLVFIPPTNDDEYVQPDWSPDGKYIYFSHVNYKGAPVQQGAHYPLFEIYRMAYPDGQPEKLVEQAFWPRVSADSSRLAYVSLDPMTGKNKPYLANADGTAVTELVLSGQLVPDIIDAPDFSPDEQSLLFSAPVPAQSYVPPSSTWLEKLFGITVASAHTVPSEWWSVPLGGGTATQLTHLQATGLFASVSPDKKHIASYSGNGIFVMNQDGTGLTMLVSDLGGVPGTVSWIP
jgi:Tol biopolymer transport system component